MKAMKKLKLLTVFLIAILLLPGPSSYAEPENTHTGADIDIVKHLVDSETAKLINSNSATGAVVSIVKDDKLLLSKGYGYADKKADIFADEEKTAFRIGSVSKTFVSLAAMQLYEQGKLNLNEPITKYLEHDFPKFRYPVTMHHLLTHTGGFENMDSGLFIPGVENIRPLGEVIKKYRPQQVFVPGEVASYSNYGVALAGYVIERITGKPFYQYAEENIFRPLQMNNSTFRQDGLPSVIVSKGYGLNHKERPEGILNLYPAGSIAATADDMANYMRFLLGDKNSDILRTETKLKMFQGQFTMDKEFVGLGYVWGRYQRNGHYIYMHEGGTDNFSTVLLLYPDQKLGIFFSCNIQMDLTYLMEEITDTLYGKEKPEEKDAVYPEKSQKDISGYYRPTISSFENAEKFYSIISTIHIYRNNSEGFMFNKESLRPIGKDFYYHPDLGYVKYIERNGRRYLTTSENYSFLKVPRYESLEWQSFIIVGFLICCVIGFFISLVFLIKAIKKRDKGSVFAGIPGIVLLTVAAITIAKGIAFFSDIQFAGVESFISFLKWASVAISVVVSLQAVAAASLWIQKRNLIFRIVYTLCSITSLLFVTWLFQVNLLG